MKEIRLYFEGHDSLRPGFNKFLSSILQLAREKRCAFRLIACGAQWRQDFSDAIATRRDSLNLLLIDSEGPCNDRKARELCEHNRWGSRMDSVFWMVEMMESWFHADADKMEEFYGQGFHIKSLARNPKVEEIPKQELERGLKEATKRTTKGNYFEHKTEHGRALLEKIDPARVRKSAPNCDRLFKALESRLEEYGNL